MCIGSLPFINEHYYSVYIKFNLLEFVVDSTRLAPHWPNIFKERFQHKNLVFPTQRFQIQIIMNVDHICGDYKVE